jgi:hypothetical protein
MRYTPAQAAKLWKAAESGNARAQLQFAESISQGDLINPLMPAIRKTLLANYEEIPGVSDRFTTKESLDQIDKDVEYDTFGLDQKNLPENSMGEKWIPGTLPAIANREDYPQLTFHGSSKFLRVSTVGEAFGIDWQAIVNSRGGEVDILARALQEFAKHAAQGEDAAPVKSLFKNNDINTGKLGIEGHVIAGNPKLDDILKLHAAIAQAQNFKIDGVDVQYDKFALVTAPKNVPLIKQIMSTRTLTQVPARTGDASTNRSAQFEQTLDLGAEIDVVGYRWITAFAPAMADAWILIPVGGLRPLVTKNYLKGYETPSIWIKDSNARQVGGGAVPLLDGDFDSDAIQTKVRHAIGSSVLWNEGIVYSNGKGV